MPVFDKLKERMKTVAEIRDVSLVETFGKLKTTPEIQEQRMNICLGCEHLFKATSSCKICGCFMRVKTWIGYEKCPAGKWGPVQDPPKED